MAKNAEKIVQKDDPVLRLKAREIAPSEIGSPEVKGAIERTKKALTEEPDGVAIAAPQIGVSLRLFVVSGKVFSTKEELESGKITAPDLIFINPKIIKHSRKNLHLEEGCLSIRWLYGKVRRADKTTVEAYDERGKKFTRGGSGLLSQIFQHEIDHLEGILFTDKAKNLHELRPENKDKDEK